jgi:uncharacterized protein DUF2585
MDPDSAARERPLWHYLLIAAGIAALAGLVELAMGRVAISKSGQLRLWVSDVNTAENSQQIADWYSFSHIIHGIALYGFFRLVSRRKWKIGVCLVAAIVVEAAWEVFENTPFTIERYRHATISLDYYGDSVLNSMCDMLFCVGGFFLASRLPVWASVALVVAMEAGVALAIRDNLTLNIVMLLHPFEFIRNWQHGAGWNSLQRSIW